MLKLSAHIELDLNCTRCLFHLLILNFTGKAGNSMKCILFFFLMVLVSRNCIAQNDPVYYSTGENLTQKTEKYLFIRVETDKKEALAGECIVARYRLFVAVDIQGKLSKSPSFSGFASYDMESGNADAYEVEKSGGIPFRVYLIKQVQLFGLRPGLQRLQPVELEATIRYRKKMQGNKSGAADTSRSDTLFNYSLKSPPADIMVHPLPAGKPAGFSGAVGQFEFSNFASATTIAAGKADTLHLILKGSGNWHEITFPEIKWPAGTEVFQPFETENTNPYSVPLQGLRTVAYPVVFNQKGIYLIPPADFSYFDPVEKKFKTSRSDSIRISVTDPEKKEMNVPVKKNSSLTALFSRYAIIVFPLLALILLGILIFRWRKP
jgi:hypothetical protein